MRISNCWVYNIEVNTTNVLKGKLYIGGIIGGNSRMKIVIQNCHSSGVIGRQGGGIIGGNTNGEITISNCTFTGTFSKGLKLL